MKILAISGSSRDKNTNYMLWKVLEAIGNEHSAELLTLKDKNIEPCRNCKGCHKTFRCVIQDDMQRIHERLKESEVILFGSPAYFDNVSSTMKLFMDRCLPFYFSGELKGKRVGLVSVGGFKEYIRYDVDGDCFWCQIDNACARTVERCLNSLSYFCDHLRIEVVGRVAAIHGSPELRDKELLELGWRLTEV